MSSRSHQYAVAIDRFIRGFPPNTPVITITLALDRDKPGFIVLNNWSDAKWFPIWWKVSVRAIDRLKQQRGL
ncbi:MAG: hypothetical protein AAGA31_10760 [Bacteroidota bacterium]